MKPETSIVGRRLPPFGAANKVTGAARYVIDVALPGALVGKLLHSPHAHARIRSIDKSRAEKLPGVAAVLTWHDIPQRPFNPAVLDWMSHDASADIEDMYIISEKARFVGDIVAAVAAVDEPTALEALALVKVDYEVLPAVLDPLEAMKPGVPVVHERFDGNISRTFPFPGSRGDVVATLKDADVRVDLTVRTSKQYMMPLEPLSCVASFAPSGELTVWMPCQRPMIFKMKIAQLFGLSEANVNLVCDVGGGFFGEANWTPLPICVALAKASGKPVRLELTREETVLNTASREAYVASGRLGLRRDGSITGLDVDLLVESGAYYNRSSACTGVTMANFAGLYRYPAFAAKATAVYSNIPMASGARGYGGPPAFFLLEQLMDMAAKELGMDPFDLRLMNFKHMGERGHFYPLETDTQEKILRLGAERFGWAEKRRRHKVDGPLRRGVGLANYFDVSGGQPFERFDRMMEMKLNDDGTVVVIFNHPDGGMNLLGTLAQIAAESLGVRYQDVSFVTDSTKGKLFDVGMAANSGLYTLGNALIKTAASLKRNILAEAARQLKGDAGGLDLQDGSVVRKDSREPVISLLDLARNAVNGHGEASRAIGAVEAYRPEANPNPFGSVFADVTVDVETGEVKIRKIVLVHDIGRAINPLTVEGQLEGGIALGIGYALFEDAAIDPKNGVTRGANFNSYRLPTTFEVPDIDVVLYEDPTPSGPFGGKGVGMCGPHAIAPAVANAIYDAVGVRIAELPLTPERVLAAIRARG